MVQGTFAPPNALLESLPRITPPAGSTPKAVNLSVVYDGATNMATFGWTQSGNAHFDHYSVRYCIGDKWDDDLEATLKTISKIMVLTDTAALATILTLPGAALIAKIFVVTDTNNEKGSNAVKVKRIA